MAEKLTYTEYLRQLQQQALQGNPYLPNFGNPYFDPTLTADEKTETKGEIPLIVPTLESDDRESALPAAPPIEPVETPQTAGPLWGPGMFPWQTVPAGTGDPAGGARPFPDPTITPSPPEDMGAIPTEIWPWARPPYEPAGGARPSPDPSLPAQPPPPPLPPEMLADPTMPGGFQLPAQPEQAFTPPEAPSGIEALPGFVDMARQIMGPAPSYQMEPSPFYEELMKSYQQDFGKMSELAEKNKVSNRDLFTALMFGAAAAGGDPGVALGVGGQAAMALKMGGYERYQEAMKDIFSHRQTALTNLHDMHTSQQKMNLEMARANDERGLKAMELGVDLLQADQEAKKLEQAKELAKSKDQREAINAAIADATRAKNDLFKPGDFGMIDPNSPEIEAALKIIDQNMWTQIGLILGEGGPQVIDVRDQDFTLSPSI